ncbi:Prolyl 4-hydroxylase 1, partial [Turnera subulata]
MAPAMKIVFALLTFVTVGMIIGALFQLAFIRKLEESSGGEFPSFKRVHSRGFLQMPGGIPYWENDKEAELLRVGYVKPEIVSWSPRIIVLHNFLSSQGTRAVPVVITWVRHPKASYGKISLAALFGIECDYLVALARPRLQSSTVVDVKTGKESKFKWKRNDHRNHRVASYLASSFQGIKSNVRTSSGMFLNTEERGFPMVQAIEKRISVYSQVPIENGELIQVLRYEKDQFYKPHHDYFSDTFNLKRGGQRVATMLMYLSDNVEGGETYFPKAGPGECSCGGKVMEGLSVKPVKGDAVLFWSMGLDGQSDPNSIHGGCAVLAGIKGFLDSSSYNDSVKMFISIRSVVLEAPFLFDSARCLPEMDLVAVSNSRVHLACHCSAGDGKYFNVE